ncbi:MAG TPA: alpha-L-fucosidase [Fimbriimonadaceae bacterium]|nr:alpha-L-fucosidase [Fimbriimonadaceae bacterium]
MPTPEPRIATFESLAFGMFVHWGLYSQLGRGEWVQHAEKIAGPEYLKLMDSFTGKDFDAKALAKAAKRAGMRYITHTTRHHEGFSLYDTLGLSPLDVTHTPCGRDLVREFIDACWAEGIVPMLYHTTLDWNDPRFDSDWDGYLRYLRDSVEVLCTGYGRIGGLWFDGNWSRPEADWQEDALYAVIRKHQPEAMIVNNTGTDALGAAGNPEIDSVTFERGRPSPLNREGMPKYVAAEMCHTMNFHWGVATKDFNYLSPAHVIEELCFARRAGANLLMNVGPLADGALPSYETAALSRVGDWIELHGGSNSPIYRGRPCGVTGEGNDFCLAHGDDLYFFVTDLTPTSNTMVHGVPHRGPGPRRFLGVPDGYMHAVWMDNGEELKVEREGETLVLHSTAYPYGTNTVIRIAHLPLPSGN